MDAQHDHNQMLRAPRTGQGQQLQVYKQQYAITGIATNSPVLQLQPWSVQHPAWSDQQGTQCTGRTAQDIGGNPLSSMYLVMHLQRMVCQPSPL
jgi:hypothetical protein